MQHTDSLAPQWLQQSSTHNPAAGPARANNTNKGSPPACRAKDLISKLLTIQPSTRLTASQALQHQWLTGDLGAVPNLSKTRQNMRRHLRSKFRVSLGLHTPQLPRAERLCGSRCARELGAVRGWAAGAVSVAWAAGSSACNPGACAPQPSLACCLCGVAWTQGLPWGGPAHQSVPCLPTAQQVCRASRLPAGRSAGLQPLLQLCVLLLTVCVWLGVSSACILLHWSCGTGPGRQPGPAACLMHSAPKPAVLCPVPRLPSVAAAAGQAHSLR